MNQNNKPKPPILPPILSKKKYSVSLYTAFKGKWSKLSKQDQAKALKLQWYVRWYYRNPATGKMTRQLNYYGHTNSFHTYKERIAVLRFLKANLENLLANGFNPYSIKNKEIDGKSNAFDAIDYAMGIKKNHMKHSSFVRFTSDINKFKDYLEDNGYNMRFISSIDKKTVTNYLNSVVPEVSTRSRNNYRTNIGSLWQILEDEGVIERNFVKSIPMLKSIPKRNRLYTDEQVESIFEYLKHNDPNLLLYIKFISFNMLRNIEASRLKVSDISINEKTLFVFVKQGYTKKKIIPEILLNELPEISGKSGYIFGKDGLFQEWDVSDERRRAFYTAKFTKVKDYFKLSEDYSLYSFRHWAITKLFIYFRNDLNLGLTQTYDELMKITGHTSLKGLLNYLRSIDVDMPLDYSKGFD